VIGVLYSNACNKNDGNDDDRTPRVCVRVCVDSEFGVCVCAWAGQRQTDRPIDRLDSIRFNSVHPATIHSTRRHNDTTSALTDCTIKAIGGYV